MQHRMQFFSPAYLESASAANMPWGNWLCLFNFFINGSELDAGSKLLKLAVLYGLLGAEGARIASDLTDATTSYNDTIKRLTERFGERQSVIYARTTFYRRNQQKDEDILVFVTELRRLATYCKFGAVELENVRDRLVAGCLDERIRERLFQEPENLTLDAAVVLAQTVERAKFESARLATAASSSSNELLKVDRGHPHGRYQRDRSKSTARRSPSHQRSSSRSNDESCWNCGGRRHPMSKCPAHGKTCTGCGKPNHFAKVCRSKQRGAADGQRDSNRKNLNTISIAAINGTDTNSSIDVKLNGISTRLLIDTGAQASVISQRVYRRVAAGRPLKPPSNNLKAYGGGNIPICGTVLLQVTYQKERVDNFCFFVVRRGPSILVQDLFDALNFQILDSEALCIRALSPTRKQPSSSHSSATTSTVNSRYPLLQMYQSVLHADPTKSIKGYAHKPTVNLLLPPVAQPLRRVPLALLSKVKETLDRMIRDGVF